MSAQNPPQMSEEEEAIQESQGKLFNLYKHRNINVGTTQALEKEKKITQLTLVEIKDIPADNTCYKSIGRMFIQKSKSELQDELHKNVSYLGDKLKELGDSRQNLNKKIVDEEATFREVAAKLQEKHRASQQTAQVK
ncbi:prefoldin subunit 1 [Acrasis kona]|uniref:Prefoldin subunit 1 n=1 Tax=Acrasis kona TaxID=1008807 RepID=A0AAW2ZJ79_9EUKA